MSKVDRKAITEMFSKQLERQILCRYPIWAAEVKLDDYHWMYSADKHKGRVDYMAFEPQDMSRSIRSLEAGILHVFEVKSCMDDFKSGHGMNKVGDVNWLVCTKELWTELYEKNVDTSGWRPLIYGWITDGKFNPCPLRYTNMDIIGRKLPLVQALWMMLQSTRSSVSPDMEYEDATFHALVRAAKVQYSEPTTMSQLKSENRKLRWLAREMYRTDQGVLAEANDTVWCGTAETLRDAMDYHMQTMKALGFPPDDYDERMIELGWTEVE